MSSEDLENVPLVRMEDVQPSRERSYKVSTGDSDEDSVEEVLGTCVIEDIVYDTEYIVNNDEDSNIGSMVSIKPEVTDDDDGAELIVPDVVNDVPLEIKYEQRLPESSWPTLEILPGGVIQKPDHTGPACANFDEDFAMDGEMMYACAKCSQSFRFLYSLVKHVKWHEEETKKLNKAKEITTEFGRRSPCTGQTNCKHTKPKPEKRKLIIVKANNKLSTKKLKS